MKKIYSIIAGLFLVTCVLAQAPNKMSYQAIIRNTSNTLVGNSAVGMRISILQTSVSGTAVYVETQTPTTNANGLASIEIGGGTVVSGNFTTIDWANGPYFIKTETDPAGGTNYTITGTSQLLSVPYAMYAANSGSSIPGPQGPQGLTGAAGPQGPQGLTGATGPQGGTGNLVFPTITTNTVSGITSNSATFGGVISNANGNQIIERGIVYSTTPNPTISSNRIVIGNGIGTFDTISALGYQYTHLLNPNTTYYVRAYAITENNISAYGNEVSFTTLSVGQVGSGGGIVFFNKGNATGGWQFLETALSNQSTGISWGCDTLNPIPGTQLSVGSGETNTALIVAGCTDLNFAAKLCANLTLGGQSDWFLPSRDELNLMYKNLHLNNQGNFNTSTYYWSSTEINSDMAWCFKFVNGDAGQGSKATTSFYVRAVRAF